MKEAFRPTVLRNKAWNALSGKWGASAVAFLIFFLLSLAVNFIQRGTVLTVTIYCILWIFGVCIISIGMAFLWLDVSNGKPVEIRTLFEAFYDYLRYLIGLLLSLLYIVLWSLLLVIPGIIKSISYSQMFYLMREDPQLSGEEAIRLSMKMMKGHKMEYFLLGLSFIGWILLSILTLGILLLWIGPYMQTALAEFYKELKKEFEGELVPNATA